MDAVKYFEIKDRMTKGCSVECSQCELDAYNNGSYLTCSDLEYENPGKAVSIVEKWDEEHPLKTRAQVFFEAFPDALKNKADGTPEMCPFKVGLKLDDKCFFDKSGLANCKACWNEPAPDKYQY